ncbi:hypothetical protein HNR46_003997 [Haloferula luteola]|uniref:DUF6268 domain-containing protein n=1 Tax=Haloferula luteola TaxID=595692 RepID=A0A840V9I5_9BACT|nr:DUF6268 family outer membrane beta-barrel protein [Haloferula luteola]MBB5353736.1 hypothetical protein [Haloferula luteola]
MIPLLIAGTALVAPLEATPTDDTLKIADYVNVASLRVTHSFGMDFDSPGQGDLDFTNLGAFAMLGQVDLPGGLTWLPALSYDLSHLELDGAHPALSRLVPSLERPLHRIDFYNFLIGQGSDGWLYGMMITPGIHSSMDDIGSDDFFLSAAAGVGYRFSESLILGLGIYGSDLANDPSFFVGPGFLWEIDENWSSFFYGTRFVLRRQLGDDRSIGVEGAWNGGEWATEYAGRDAQLEFDSIRAGLTFRQRLFDDVWLDLAAGVTFGNELSFTTDDGRGIHAPGVGEAEASPYVRLGVTVGSW